MISAKDIKDGTEAGASLATSLVDLFPGTAARSMTNAHSYSVQALTEDLNKLKRFAKENNISEELQKALVQFAFEQHGASERLAQCVEKAAPFLEERSSPESLDSEWLDYWRVHASSVRSAELQEIWGAILANEVNRPGAISKRAMSILSTMDRDDAVSFEKLCSYTVVLECED